MVLVPIKNKSDVPEDYTYITPYQARLEQWNLIRTWEPKSEVWPILHGDKFIAGFCALSNVFINTMFRKKLKLHMDGFIMTNFYAIVGGGAFGGHFFKSMVTEELLLYKPSCFTCIELKAILMTNTVALIFPALSVPFINLGLAGSTGLRVPYWNEGRELMRFWWSVIKPGLPHLAALCIANSLVVSLIAYKQANAVNNIGEIVHKVDKYLREKKSTTFYE